MGLLSKLKSMLGLESSERPPGSGVDVTVEREPDADDATDADDESAADAAATEPADAEESPAEDADSVTDDDSEYVTTDADVGTDAGDDADDDDTESDEDAASEAEPDAEPEPDDLTEIKGVGPAYADRLNDAGIATFAALADADADELAAETDLSPKRVGRWIDRAADR